MLKTFLRIAGIPMLSGLAALSSADSTFATFKDPTVGSFGQLFQFDSSKASTQFTGGWTGSGLTLSEPLLGTSYSDVHMAFTGTTLTSGSKAFGALGSGSFTFSALVGASYANVLTVMFDSATISKTNFFSTGSSNVRFLDGFGSPYSSFKDESFSFAFANVKTAGSKTTYTASFGAGADPVPEPFTFALGVGGIGLFVRRRARR